MSFFLDRLGATARVRADFSVFARRGWTLARVSQVNRGGYRIWCDNGQEVAAEPTGALLYGISSEADLPAVGDWVAAQSASSGNAVLHAVLPRTCVLSRRAAGKREEQQILAANVDCVFIVCGLDHDFNLRRIERYLLLARDSRVQAVVVLNKSDLCFEAEKRACEAAEIAPGVLVLVIQANSPAGIAPVRSFLTLGKTIALLGSSGAGKSTLVNQLLSADIQETGAVREKDSRGRHTTTARQLILLPDGGVLIDTPGLREIQLWAGEESVEETFPEIAAASRCCRFRDCSHSGEPGCAVEMALGDGSIDPARWRNYQKLISEVRHHEIAADRLAQQRQKQRWKAINKAMRNLDKRR